MLRKDQAVAMIRVVLRGRYAEQEERNVDLHANGSADDSEFEIGCKWC